MLSNHNTRLFIEQSLHGLYILSAVIGVVLILLFGCGITNYNQLFNIIQYILFGLLIIAGIYLLGAFGMFFYIWKKELRMQETYVNININRFKLHESTNI